MAKCKKKKKEGPRCVLVTAVIWLCRSIVLVDRSLIATVAEKLPNKATSFVLVRVIGLERLSRITSAVTGMVSA